jgi:phage terminase large subunit GpA-like protein
MMQSDRELMNSMNGLAPFSSPVLVTGSFFDAWKLPPKLTVSEWADAERYLSPESSAEPGKWQTSRVPYAKEPMDCINDPEIESIVLMWGAQLSKTESLNNIIGYFVHYDPSPILYMQPTLEMAETVSKDRIAPMIRDTPALTNKFKDPRTRDSGNTVKHKSYKGGHLTLCGANSPSSLASRPIRIVLADETDRYPFSAGAEGDPVKLARKRTATFWNRKIVETSTPTVKGASKIETAFEGSDMRFYFVPCPACGEFQKLEWNQVKWEKDKPETAYYECSNCEYHLNDADRLKSLSKGEWRATKETKKIAGFFLNGIYSPWISLEEAATEFLEAKKTPENLRVFINTYLAETWEEQGEKLDTDDLLKRREDYTIDKIPEGVLVITAGVDVQDDRLELEYFGWGKYEECWSLDYKVLYGDPSAPQVWQDLTDALSVYFKHPWGPELAVKSICIDTGGHNTKDVYDYCKSRGAGRIFPIKGIGGEGKPLVGRGTRNNIGKVKLFPIGTNTAKDLIYARLKIKEHGPGFCHFPKHYDQEYFDQLTAEKRITRYEKGFKKYDYVKTRNRNEALDTRVYGYAALALLKVNFNAVSARMKKRWKSEKEKQKEEVIEEVEQEKTEEIEEDPKPKRIPKRKRPARPRRQKGFAKGWQ